MIKYIMFIILFVCYVFLLKAVIILNHQSDWRIELMNQIALCVGGFLMVVFGALLYSTFKEEKKIKEKEREVSSKIPFKCSQCSSRNIHVNTKIVQQNRGKENRESKYFCKDCGKYLGSITIKIKHRLGGVRWNLR